MFVVGRNNRNINHLYSHKKYQCPYSLLFATVAAVLTWSNITNMNIEHQSERLGSSHV